jgi:hypothetical protein
MYHHTWFVLQGRVSLTVCSGWPQAVTLLSPLGLQGWAVTLIISFTCHFRIAGHPLPILHFRHSKPRGTVCTFLLFWFMHVFVLHFFLYLTPSMWIIFLLLESYSFCTFSFV